MSNRKSIFFKYFVICSAVILISFVCLGTVLLLVSSRYFIDEKKEPVGEKHQGSCFIYAGRNAGSACRLEKVGDR